MSVPSMLILDRPLSASLPQRPRALARSLFARNPQRPAATHRDETQGPLSGIESQADTTLAKTWGWS